MCDNSVNRLTTRVSPPANANVNDVVAGGFHRTTEREMEQDFTAIMAEYGGALRRVASTYEANPTLQEDLFQEIGLAVWQALPRFRGEASLKTFVFRIAHNRGLRHGWRERRVPDNLEVPDNVADRVSLPEDESARTHRLRQLQAAIHSLPMSLRQVITLRLEGMSYSEIAEIMGLSENNVMVRASRARSKLKHHLSPTNENRND